MRRISYTMDGFCLLYLLLILLMRSGDVETNPGPNTAVSTVSDKEFLKLAQDITPSYYEAVGISLGIPYAQLQKILSEKLKNYTEALMDVFNKWNVMQNPSESNVRENLAAILRDAKLDLLSDILLNEHLIPNSTEGPSRPPSAEFQTKPLSPELVDRCAKDFKTWYKSTVCKIRTDPLNPASTVQFKDRFTNLVLQEEHGTEKRNLDYNDILDLEVNGDFPKRIMVQGEAGIGKTTFCAKIAWDWIKGRHFGHFVWVLIVPLRELKKRTIGEIAKSYLAKNNPATVSQITKYIRSNPAKIFIAFDGLEEVTDKIVKPKSSVTSEACVSSSENGDIGLVDILRLDQLDTCPVLVTTRPSRAVEIRSDCHLMKLYTFIHVKGFSRENLSFYIHKYFPQNEDGANELIQLLVTSENDFISEKMAHYPIYAAMLCLMWKEQKLKKTFSQIFKKMIDLLKEHDAQKEETKVGSSSDPEYLKTLDELLRPIAKIAFTGLLENTLVFNEDDFEKKSKETACRIGILSQEDRITTSMDIHVRKRNPHVQLPVFFPHKLFQDYMAGVHLAFLYESDRNEFNRLIEEVVLPKKEEFRYLLYFTVSQSKSIAIHVMKSMLQGLNMNIATYTSQEQLDFIVDVAFESQDKDVAFESQDKDVAALVKDKVLSEAITLTIARDMTAHTVAGYAFIRPHVIELDIRRDCGPSMSLDVADMICSMPSLKKVSLQGAFHHSFFATLAKKRTESKVQTLQLHVVQCPNTDSSEQLAEALCFMPNLTDLTLEMVLDEKFYSILKDKASYMRVQTLKLHATQCPTPASSRNLAEALCSMTKLTKLKLIGRYLNKEFYSTLAAKASNIQVRTLKLDNIQCPTPASSQHLAEALCSMPNLTNLTLLEMDPNEEFYSTLKAKALTIQVQTLKLDDVQCPTPASSHLAEALCSMPNLTNLKLLGSELNGEFFSTLKARASSIQLKGRTLRIHHESGYLKLKDDEELDDATKKLRKEGCAPKTPPTSNKEDEEELVLPIKGNEIPAKKKKKSEIKKKAHDGHDSESTPDVKIQKKKDEDYRRKKEQTKQEDDRRTAGGSEQEERGESRRRSDDDEAKSSYHSTRYEDDETKVKRRGDEQMDQNHRRDREREDKPRMDKRGSRSLDGERESKRRGDREERRNDRSREREDKRDREKERGKRDRERQRDRRDRRGEKRKR